MNEEKYQEIADIANRRIESRYSAYSNHFKAWEVREILKAAMIDEVIIQTSVCEMLEMPKVFNGEGYV